MKFLHILKLLCWLYVVFISCDGFLFDTSTPSGGADRYTDLLAMVKDIQSHRSAFEKYLTGDLQKVLQTLTNQSKFHSEQVKVLQLENSNIAQMIHQLKNRRVTRNQTDIVIGHLNASIGALEKDYDNAMKELDTLSGDIVNFKNITQSKNASRIENQISEMNELVSLQACGGFNKRTENRVVFPDLKYSTGFQDLSSFTKDAVFRCEKRGLYLIIACVTAVSSESRINILLNNSTVLSRVQIVPQHDYVRHMIHSGTGSAVTMMNPGDTIIIGSENLEGVYGEKSCISIIKLR